MSLNINTNHPPSPWIPGTTVPVLFAALARHNPRADALLRRLLDLKLSDDLPNRIRIRGVMTHFFLTVGAAMGNLTLALLEREADVQLEQEYPGLFTVPLPGIYRPRRDDARLYVYKLIVRQKISFDQIASDLACPEDRLRQAIDGEQVPNLRRYRSALKKWLLKHNYHLPLETRVTRVAAAKIRQSIQTVLVDLDQALDQAEKDALISWRAACRRNRAAAQSAGQAAPAPPPIANSWVVGRVGIGAPSPELCDPESLFMRLITGAYAEAA